MLSFLLLCEIDFAFPETCAILLFQSRRTKSTEKSSDECLNVNYAPNNKYEIEMENVKEPNLIYENNLAKNPNRKHISVPNNR